MRVLGTSVESIMATEDRDLFNRKLTEINQPFAEGRACADIESCVDTANDIGYPVMCRAVRFIYFYVPLHFTRILLTI